MAADTVPLAPALHPVTLYRYGVRVATLTLEGEALPLALASTYALAFLLAAVDRGLYLPPDAQLRWGDTVLYDGADLPATP